MWVVPKSTQLRRRQRRFGRCVQRGLELRAEQAEQGHARRCCETDVCKRLVKLCTENRTMHSRGAGGRYLKGQVNVSEGQMQTPSTQPRKSVAGEAYIRVAVQGARGKLQRSEWRREDCALGIKART